MTEHNPVQDTSSEPAEQDLTASETQPPSKGGIVDLMGAPQEVLEALQCADVPPHALQLEDVSLLLCSLGLPDNLVVELSAHYVIRHVRLPPGATALEGGSRRDRGPRWRGGSQG